MIKSLYDKNGGLLYCSSLTCCLRGRLFLLGRIAVGHNVPLRITCNSVAENKENSVFSLLFNAGDRETRSHLNLGKPPQVSDGFWGIRRCCGKESCTGRRGSDQVSKTT